MKIKWLGHSGFKIDKIMVDPWTERIESMGVDAPYKLKKEDENIDAIVITHGHEDHYMGAWNLAKKTKATVVGTGETIMPAMSMGLKCEMMNIGGSVNAGGWKITLVYAAHTGNATGVILEKDDWVIYHAGDTGLFGDMEFIGKHYKPCIAILPIGGRFTMDVSEATTAAQLLGAKYVIPMHYNTFPMITANPAEFKKNVEAHKKSEVRVMKVGEEIDF